MKKSLNKKTFCLTAAALALTAGLTVGNAMAYFTTYATASGGAQISLGFTTTIPKENVTDWTKHIQVLNTGDYDCYVRVKVFAGAKYQDSLTYSDDSGKWSLGADGYYYYSDIVPANVGGDPEGTENLHVRLPEVDEKDESFNVIVVQECTPVLYSETGEPYADWNMIADSSQESYSENQEEVGE